MLAYVKNLNVNCDRYTRLHLVFTRELHRAGQAHRELLDACKTKDPDVAAAALWKHITEAGECLKEIIQRHREHHS
jgi:DNA-binding GntR family transcriptional regulator